jgi:hypothetical protein
MTARARVCGTCRTQHLRRDTTMFGVEHHERMVRALRAASGEARPNTGTFAAG